MPKQNKYRVLKEWIETNYSDSQPPLTASCTEHSGFKNDTGVIFPYKEFCSLWTKVVSGRIVILDSFHCTNHSYILVETKYVDKLVSFVKAFHIVSATYPIDSGRLIIRFFIRDVEERNLIDFIIKSFKEELERHEMSSNS